MGMMEEEDPAGGGGRLLPQIGQATIEDEPCMQKCTSFILNSLHRKRANTNAITNLDGGQRAGKKSLFDFVWEDADVRFWVKTPLLFLFLVFRLPILRADVDFRIQTANL